MFLINIIPCIIIATVIYSGPNIDRANYSLIKSMDWLSLVGMAMFWVGLNISSMKAHDMTGLQTRAFVLLL